MRNKRWLIYNNKYFEIRTFYKKYQYNLLISCVSVVVSGVKIVYFIFFNSRTLFLFLSFIYFFAKHYGIAQV